MRHTSLLTSFLVSIFLVVLIAGGSMTYLSETTARGVVDVMAKQLRRDRADHVTEHLEHFMGTSRKALLKTSEYIRRLPENERTQAHLEKRFLQAALDLEAASSMYLATPDGGLAGGGHDGQRGNAYFMATDDFKPGVLRKFVATEDGDRGAEVFALPGFDARKRPWFQAARTADRPTWGEPYVLSTGEDMSMPASLPVTTLDGRPLGILGMDHFVTAIGRFLREVHAGNDGATYIMDTKGRLVASSLEELPFLVDDSGRPTGARRYARDSSVPRVSQSAKAVEEQFPAMARLSGYRDVSVTIDGVSEEFDVVSFNDDWGLHWIVVTTFDKNAYLTELARAQHSNIAVILGSLVALSLVTFMFARSIIVPIVRLRDAAQAIAAGNIATQQAIEVDRSDEIGNLATSFNQMLHHLRTVSRDRELALQSVDAERQRTLMLLDVSQTVVLELSKDGAVVTINRAALDLFGYEADEIVGRNCYDVLCPEDGREKLKRRFRHRIDGTREFDQVSESELVTRAGQRLHIIWRNALVRDRDGKVVGVLSTGVDITDLKRTEARLQEALSQAQLNEQRLRDFASASSEWFWETDSEFRFTHFFRQSPETVEPRDDQLIGKYRWDLADPTDSLTDWEEHRRSLQAKMPFRNFEYRRQGRFGKRWLSVSGVPIHDDAGNFVGYRGTGSDITARKEIETRLIFTSQIIEMLSEGVNATRLSDGAIVYTNPKFDSLFGCEPGEMLGKHVSVLNAATDETPLERAFRLKDALQQGDRWQDEVINVRKDGTTFLSEVSFNVYVHPEHGRLAIAVRTDITERRANEKRLLQTQRMEALGQLTGGVAHDFNNLLAIALGSAELLEDEVADDAGALRHVATIKRAIDRAEELTSRLLAFSRRQHLSPSDVNVLGVLHEMEDMLHRTLGADIALSIIGDDPLWLARVDPGQLETAVINLAINARQAMPAGGSLRIEARNTAADRDPGARNAANDLASGDYVKITVTDTGAGMSPDVAAKAFEPFFTTKEVGEGTGLGLSMVYGFASQTGGAVTLDTAPGEGTCVTIYLPRAAASAEAEERAGPTDLQEGGSERLLVVEDNTDVRTTIVTILTRAGYSIAEATNANEAMIVAAEQGPFDLLLTDIVLPGSSDGRALASALSSTCPDMQVLYMSGYPRDAHGSKGTAMAGWLLLMKPFGRADLLTAIRTTLDRPGTGGSR